MSFEACRNSRYTLRVQGRQRTFREPTHQGWTRPLGSSARPDELPPRQRVHRWNKNTRPGLRAAGRRLAAEEGSCAASAGAAPSNVLSHPSSSRRDPPLRRLIVAQRTKTPSHQIKARRLAFAQLSRSRQTAPKQSRRQRPRRSTMAVLAQLKGSDASVAKSSMAQYATPTFCQLLPRHGPEACAHM